MIYQILATNLIIWFCVCLCIGAYTKIMRVTLSDFKYGLIGVYTIITAFSVFVWLFYIIWS